jgi:hypothetical protein
MIKSRRMRWEGHVSRMRIRRMHIGYRLERQKERDHWENQDVGELTIKMDLKRDGVGWYGLD